MDERTANCIDYIKQCCENETIGELSAWSFDISPVSFVELAEKNGLEFIKRKGDVLQFKEKLND